MRFAVFTSLLAVASAAATPRAPKAQVSDVVKQAEASIAELEAQACDVFACIAAAAPLLPVCAAALIEPTPLGEIACIAGLVNLGANTPPACQGC